MKTRFCTSDELINYLVENYCDITPQDCRDIIEEYEKCPWFDDFCKTKWSDFVYDFSVF